MSSADHATLVEQVKQLERADPGANRQWECYGCDTHGGGSRDPALHDVAFLQAFLQSYRSGTAVQPQLPSDDPEQPKLVQQIQELQRTNWEAQQKWLSYCDRNGGGKRDPTLHSAAFLQAFFEAYDSIVTGFAPGATAPSDPEHARLVEEVKQLERTDPAVNQKWASYCDTHGGGSRDPARHDKLFLQAFLKLQGQADHRELKAAMAGLPDPAAVVQETPMAGGFTATPIVEHAQPAGGTEAAPPRGAAVERPSAPTPEPEHANLVEQIKQLERTDPEAQKQWCSYADKSGGPREPARHDTAFLRAFLDSYDSSRTGQQLRADAPAQAQVPALDSQHTSLVEQVKQLERADPQANSQWECYCDTHGGGSRDPALHEAAFLQAFLESYRSGTAPQPQVPSHDAEQPKLVQQIQELQRTSWEAQQKWLSYCDRNGGGKRDPALHSAAFLQAFLDAYDSIVTGFGPGATAPSDPEHARLVEEVKQLERTDPAVNQKWASYCDTHGGGSRDPARHDKLFLQAFLKLQGQVADHRELKAAMAGSPDPAAMAHEASVAGGA